VSLPAPGSFSPLLPLRILTGRLTVRHRAGKIRFIGFSTHAPTPVIVKAIETGVFDCVKCVTRRTSDTLERLTLCSMLA
jgi:hypothetical protein